MKKKTIWTIELPSNAAYHAFVRSEIYKLGGKIVSAKEEYVPLTNEECRFWYKRWTRLPFYDCNVSNNTAIAYCFKNGELKSGKAKCSPDDVFNHDFGCALAAARLHGDRKLERALLRFTPKQIERYF